MSQIVLFHFKSNDVRVTTDENSNHWFNASDICQVLGYSDFKQALDMHVHPEDLALFETETKGGVQKQNHVNESGLYTLIFGSRMEEARAFKRWVTSEVLPSIRKTGGYTLKPHEMKRLAFFENGKKDPSLALDPRHCDLEIAKITGDTETAARIQADIDAETHWRENTAQGWAETFFATVGPGYAQNVTVPAHLKVDDVIRCAKRFFKEKGIPLEIEKYGSSQFWFETLY